MSYKTGKSILYMIPCPIESNAMYTIPSGTLDVLHRINHFIAEKAKTARHFIKNSGHPMPLQQLSIIDIDDAENPWQKLLLEAMEKGFDVGILSEAGCPGVADPGASVVRWAHEKKIKVVPLTGPSSILLALMASGFGGQQFAFLGYLPSKVPALIPKIKQIEQASRKGITQIFMETPYRNSFLLEQLIKVCQENTSLCVACDISSDHELIITQKISAWKKADTSIYHKRPCIFIIG